MIRFAPNSTIRFDVPVNDLIANLDPASRSRPDTLLPGVVGMLVAATLFQTLAIPGVMFLLTFFGATWRAYLSPGGAAIITVIFFLTLIMGLVMVGPFGWFLGYQHPMAPRPFWTIEVADGKMRPKAFGDNIRDKDYRTAQGVFDAAEGRDAQFIFTAGQNTWQKLAVGGLLALAGGMGVLIFLMATVLSE